MSDKNTPLKIAAFKDITYFLLESDSSKALFNADVYYVKDANEAHAYLRENKADLVFMSYDDTLSMIFEDKYSEILATMPIHGSILDFCGRIDLSQNKNKVGIDTNTGYARALRCYFKTRYSSDDYNKLEWKEVGATNLRYTKLIDDDIDATLLNPPYSYKKRANRIVRMYDVLGDYQGVVVNVNKSWFDNHVNSNRLKKFASVLYSRVQEMKTDPKKTLIEIKKFYNLSDYEAAEVYASLWQEDGLSLTSEFDINKLQGTENIYTKDTGNAVTLPRTWIKKITLKERIKAEL